MSRNILITGATGTIGSILAEELSKAGVSARALVRSREKGAALEKLGHEAFVGDLSQPESLRPALEGVERVFLLSAPDERQAVLQSNLVRAAKDAGVRHIVKLSAIGAGSAPFSLARLHRETEEEIERSGAAWTHLRPNGFMQNTFMFARSIKSDGVFYAPLGEARVSYVDARDVAATAFAALTKEGHEGKAYDITGPEALSYNDVARELSSATGKEVRYVDVPAEAARGAMLGMGMQPWLADALIELFTFYRNGEAALVTDAVRAMTGRAPGTFAQFAKEYAEAFK